jgi:hypothetical protein
LPYCPIALLPYCPIARAYYPWSVMLSVYGMHLFYNLSSSAMEDALYDIEAMEHFVA